MTAAQTQHLPRSEASASGPGDRAPHVGRAQSLQPARRVTAGLSLHVRASRLHIAARDPRRRHLRGLRVAQPFARGQRSGLIFPAGPPPGPATQPGALAYFGLPVAPPSFRRQWLAGQGILSPSCDGNGWRRLTVEVGAAAKFDGQVRSLSDVEACGPSKAWRASVCPHSVLKAARCLEVRDRPSDPFRLLLSLHVRPSRWSNQ